MLRDIQIKPTLFVEFVVIKHPENTMELRVVMDAGASSNEALEGTNINLSRYISNTIHLKIPNY